MIWTLKVLGSAPKLKLLVLESGNLHSEQTSSHDLSHVAAMDRYQPSVGRCRLRRAGEGRSAACGKKVPDARCFETEGKPACSTQKDAPGKHPPTGALRCHTVSLQLLHVFTTGCGLSQRRAKMEKSNRLRQHGQGGSSSILLARRFSAKRSRS